MNQRNLRWKSNWRPGMLCAAWSLGVPLLVGCSATPAGLAMKVIGEVVDSADVAQLKGDLVGQPVAAADAKFGGIIDSYAEVDSPRRWRVYPVKLDALDNYRYVVEVSGGRIAAVTKTKRVNDPLVSTGRLAIYKSKAMNKTPKECETALEKGPPVLILRSEKTGEMVKLFDAQIIKGFGASQYVAVRFNDAGRCSEVRLLTAAASSKENPVER